MEERTFGRYELLERIDVGGMAEVFRAKLRGAAGFERIVAVKRILPYIAESAEVRTMFVDEAKLAVQLNHPNIAQVFDLGEVDGHYFIAMEFVDGHSVRAILERFAERGRRLPEDATCTILCEVAEALHHAHFAEDSLGRPLGVIHRDVSPHNVLLSYAGEVKVIDFGLAKAANRASQTKAGVVKGKLAYLSPEQAHGRPIDRRSDLFSLGICAWEMLTGERAFRRDNDRETVLAIRAGEIEPPSRHAPVDPALERVVMRALAVDPDARFGTARELREALDAYREQAGHRLGKRELQALMRATFPERFAEEVAPGAAIELIKRKPPSVERPALPPLPAESTQIELVEELAELEESAATQPGARPDDGSWSDATDVKRADDTVPGIDLPDDG